MKIHILIFLCILLSGCSDSSDEDHPFTEPKLNKPPSAPSLMTPIDGLNCSDSPLNFVWNKSSDPDGDPISYQIQLATNNSFSKNLQVRSTSNISVTFDLIKGVEYYWRVKAKDSKNKSGEYSIIRDFYSEAEGQRNHIPNAASLINPVINDQISSNSIILNWSSTDIDSNDLIFDIFIGNSNPPPLVSENHSESSYAYDLSPNKTYYWKINVMDDKGAQAVGQVWSFTTN